MALDSAPLSPCRRSCSWALSLPPGSSLPTTAAVVETSTVPEPEAWLLIIIISSQRGPGGGGGGRGGRFFKNSRIRRSRRNRKCLLAAHGTGWECRKCMVAQSWLLFPACICRPPVYVCVRACTWNLCTHCHTCLHRCNVRRCTREGGGGGDGGGSLLTDAHKVDSSA